MILSYQSDILLKEVYAGKFEQNIEAMLNDIKKFLQKEYKAVTGNSITLTASGDPKVLVQSTSRVRSFVQAYQHYKIGKIKEEPIDTATSATENQIEEFFSIINTIDRNLEIDKTSAKDLDNAEDLKNFLSDTKKVDRWREIVLTF